MVTLARCVSSAFTVQYIGRKLNHVPFLQIVTVGDLQPEPVLWHEDSGRRRYEDSRR